MSSKPDALLARHRQKLITHFWALTWFLIVPTSLRFSTDIIIKCHDTVTKRCETALVCPISYLLRTSCSTHSCPQNSFALSRQQLLHFCSALITKHSSNKTEDMVLRLLKSFQHVDNILLFDHHTYFEQFSSSPQHCVIHALSPVMSLDLAARTYQREQPSPQQDNMS